MFRVAIVLALLGSVASADPLTMSVGVRDAYRTTQRGAAVGLDGTFSDHWSWRAQASYDQLASSDGYKGTALLGYRLDVMPRAESHGVYPYVAESLGAVWRHDGGMDQVLSGAVPIELGVDVALGSGLTLRIDTAYEMTSRDNTIIGGLWVAGRID